MTISVGRRCLCGAIAALPVLHCVGAAGAVIPFCQFSKEKGWSNSRPREYITRRARKKDPSGIPEVIDKVLRSLDISPAIDVYILKDENNAFATVASGRKIVAFDVDFLQWVNAQAGTEWAAIQIVSHEIGHHIAGFSNESHRSELNADYWSGQALQRLGSSRESATQAIMSVGTTTDTQSHPNKFKRAGIIERGWDDAEGGTIDYSFCLACK
ncbi:M48 family metalloprotease [Lysobacter terrae]